MSSKVAVSFTDLDKIELKGKKSVPKKMFVRVRLYSGPARCHAAFT